MDPDAPRRRRPSGTTLRPLAGVHAGTVCAVCGWSIHPFLRNRTGQNGIHVHHVLSVSQGGDESKRNLVPLCPNHHALAHALYPVGIVPPPGALALVEELRRAEADPAAYRERLQAGMLKAMRAMRSRIDELETKKKARAALLKERGLTLVARTEDTDSAEEPVRDGNGSIGSA